VSFDVNRVKAISLIAYQMIYFDYSVNSVEVWYRGARFKMFACYSFELKSVTKELISVDAFYVLSIAKVT